MNKEVLWTALSFFTRDPFSPIFWQWVWALFPFVLLFEIPVYTTIILGVFRYTVSPQEKPHYYPRVSCLVTCYSERDGVKQTIRSLANQLYPGFIEIIPIVDGAVANAGTLAAARAMEAYVKEIASRSLTVLPRWQRGGRVSSLNAGLSIATGEVIMAIDGDTSFDNTMVSAITRHFADTNVMAVSGALRVRNIRSNLVTRFQGLEYLLSIHCSKTGLSAFNIVNNISGAFGAFRASALRMVGGWDSGTAEDLDITLRLKAYFGRNKKFRILFEPAAVGHTDTPDTWLGLFKQRLRWDGDLFYMYMRKHRASFSHKIVGWKTLVLLSWTGLFFQIVMPFIIIIYILFSIIFYSWEKIFWIFIFTTIFYAFISAILYLLFILLISERPKQDLRLAWLVPFFGSFNFIMRFVNACAILWSFVGHSHLDSSMAPWWVLRKGKF